MFTNKELLRQTESVTHTQKIITDLELLLSTVKDGETGLRGFLISKDTLFLDRFYKSQSSIWEIFIEVENAVKGNPEQQKKIQQLKIMVADKYANITISKTTFLIHNYTIDQELLNNFHTGKDIMDSIRFTVEAMQNDEKMLLKMRSEKVNSRYAALNTIVVTSLVLAFIFAGFGGVTFFKEKKARQLSNKEVDASQNELKNRIEELALANKELIEMRRQEKFAVSGRIARIIAHEVRNPLTNIDLAVGQIKEEVHKESEDLNLLFDMVTRNSNRINQLITELLNATRFTDLSFKSASINQLLDEALDMAKDRIELNKIKIVKQYSTDICSITVDAEKVKIAFLNIIINAIEAMQHLDYGELILLTKGENSKCIIEISDNGVGMDDNALSRLFEPYYTTKHKGNGLGLANTHNIILNHRGSIDVSSRYEHGTKFIIALNFTDQPYED
jgi:signal transduction histidine kinase